MTKQMELTEPESLPDDTDLIKKKANCPQRRVIRLIGVPAPELVVEDNLPSGTGDHLQGLEIIMGHAGAPVQAQERQFAGDAATPNN